MMRYMLLAIRFVIVFASCMAMHFQQVLLSLFLLGVYTVPALIEMVQIHRAIKKRKAYAEKYPLHKDQSFEIERYERVYEQEEDENATGTIILYDTEGKAHKMIGIPLGLVELLEIAHAMQIVYMRNPNEWEDEPPLYFPVSFAIIARPEE